MEQVFKGRVVNAGSLLFFPESLEVDQQNDILDSMLYLQLAASKKHDRFSDFESWKELWLAAALRFGWALKANEHVSEPLAGGTMNTAWSLAAQISSASAQGPALSRIEAFMRLASAQPSAQAAITLLASQAMLIEDLLADSSDESCKARACKSTLAFQLGFVAADRTLDIALVHFKTCQTLTDKFLFEPLDPGQVCGNVEVTAYSMGLMDQIYAPFRDVFHTARQKQDPVLVMSIEEVVDVAQP
ncbi:hypothetical protein [Pseudomonas viridiflava]|uniref:hypothetical protein n=1 Tax=Pseudomonas viridiflava TaxID=33069 RepID=UPI0020BFE16C|nr:hypothetical protein [Pseudomonas viridiflava]